MTTTHTQQYWIHDSHGTIYCKEHAGAYLLHAIRLSPRADHHVTPLGDWSRMTDAEVGEFREFLAEQVGIITDSICEKCMHDAERAS